MSSEFDFGGAAPAIRESAYDDDQFGRGAEYPFITWHGRLPAGHSGKPPFGQWVVGQESFVNAPLGWEAVDEFFYGSGPDATPEPVYTTHRLRACLVGMRRRKILTPEDGGPDLSFPYYASKANMPPGKATPSTQLMVFMPDDEVARVVALKGWTKNWALDNNLDAKFNNADFPMGVLQLAGAYAKEATAFARENHDYSGPVFPVYCMWMLDFVPLSHKKGRAVIPSYLDVGHGTFMNPFTLDLSVGKKAGIDTRYVGDVLFEQWQAFREDRVNEWVHEWPVTGEEPVEVGSGDPDRHGNGEGAYGVQEDEIPF